MKNEGIVFAGFQIEGGILPPAVLDAVATRKLEAQSKDADYDVRPGLTLRDEIGTAWKVATHLWSEFTKVEVTGRAKVAEKFCADVVRDVLGFRDVQRRTAVQTGQGTTIPAHVRLDGHTVLVTTGEGADPKRSSLDQSRTDLPGGKRLSPSVHLQEILNSAEDALWGFVSDGRRWRILRDNPTLTRPAWIDVDLERIVDGQDYAGFTLFYLLCHASRFRVADGNAHSCVMERWRSKAREEGVAARDALRDGVKSALEFLGQGFIEHPRNDGLRALLASGEVNAPTYYGDLLRLIYRMVFLFVAEDRDVLHDVDVPDETRTLYRRGYSVSRLRDLSPRRTPGDRHHDLWDGLRITFDSLASGQAKLSLPALGGIFDPGQMPSLKGCVVANENLLAAVHKLAWLRQSSGTLRVNWRDMQTEELGSVYESLLELVPRINLEERIFSFVGAGAETKGNQRKTTGSYYTPDSLVQALLTKALDPVIEDRLARYGDPECLLRIKIIDPACGSGHFLLGAARRIADRLASLRCDGVVTPEAWRQAMRDVVSRCIHGVDMNPMAVELAKVALWIESIQPGKPLGFLDSKIVSGNSLVGVMHTDSVAAGIPDTAYVALTGDDKKVAGAYRKLNAADRDAHKSGGFDFQEKYRHLASVLSMFASRPEETISDVRSKKALWMDLSQDDMRRQLKDACDLYLGAWLIPKLRPGDVGPDRQFPSATNAGTVPMSSHVWDAQAGRSVKQDIMTASRSACETASAFHWPLYFGDILQAGGFDAVLGNPPWERLKLDPQEWFASRVPEIAAAPKSSTRLEMIRALADLPVDPNKDPEAERLRVETARKLHSTYQVAKRDAEAASAFVRTAADAGGRYPRTGTGDVNTYALFTEHFTTLAGTNGRVGIIVPTGIATDATTAPFFASLVDARKLAGVTDFENRNKLFQGVDSRMRFCILTTGQDVEAAEFSFFLTDPSQMADVDRRFTLTPDQIALINPNTRTAPTFRSRKDAELTAAIYSRVPVLVNKSKGSEDNPWGVSFMAMFHMSNDSGSFRTVEELMNQGYVRDGQIWTHPNSHVVYKPLYEAKMVHHYDHRWGSYDGDPDIADDDEGKDGCRTVGPSEKADPRFEVTPRYWVEDGAIADRVTRKGWNRDWILGWRDITNSTNERTLIASVAPKSGYGDKFLLMLPSHSPRHIAVLYGCMTSLAVDYVTRQKLGGTSFKYFVMRQIPLLPPSAYDASTLGFIVPRVHELTYTSHTMKTFSIDLGYDCEPFGMDPERRAVIRAELDAWFALAYGLSRDDLRYILDPSDVMGDAYPTKTFPRLKANEEGKLGEYRTKRLVLDAYDRLVSGELGGAPSVEIAAAA